MTDLFSLDGKVAVVTGGSRGIGAMLARGLVQGGARVYISSRKADDLEATADELSADGTCVALPEDLSTQAGCDDLAAEIADRETAVHILVNNAGATWGAPIEEYPDSGWDKVLGVNVKAIFHLTRALLPQLRTAATPEDPASVVNIGSIDGLRVPAFESYAYSTSKAAVHHLTRHLAARLARDHIRVNAVAPGLFPSKMTAFMVEDEDFHQGIIDQTPLGRLGEPDDMAGIIRYLGSRASAFMTGAVIPLDGGIATTR